MENIALTPWAKIYQDMVDQGMIVPQEISCDFRYPSQIKPVASIATNSITIDDRNIRDYRAKLVSDTSGNK